jgi:benzil reductase ((S)-benzoin forming)
MSELVLITGGGTGLGRALANELAARGLPVLITGRRAEPLEATATASPRIEAVAADVATPGGRARVVAAVGARNVRFLVHNAGVLTPVGPLAKMELEAWRHAQAVNVEAPLFLTQALLPRLRGGGRVLHISSGAAHHGYAGWGSYCAGKAALHMLYEVWNLELAPDEFAVGSLRPGVVDTPMQALIRNQSPERFPAVERFRKLKEEGQLRSPEEVAAFAAWVLLETTASDFAAHEWDIGDAAHLSRYRS